jgi:hypothetical protein
MMTIDLGPGNGVQCGSTSFSINSRNLSPSTAPSYTLQAIYPCSVYAGNRLKLEDFLPATLARAL